MPVKFGPRKKTTARTAACNGQTNNRTCAEASSEVTPGLNTSTTRCTSLRFAPPVSANTCATVFASFRRLLSLEPSLTWVTNSQDKHHKAAKAGTSLLASACSEKRAACMDSIGPPIPRGVCREEEEHIEPCVNNICFSNTDYKGA